MKHKLRIWIDRLHWWSIKYEAEIMLYTAVIGTLIAVWILGGK